ncbi:hypothetical protein [uncultured Phenylobacterium sp.]|uniref:hypothetical protein n=1 Tax=uncultured Phenylobacterium sp. TaxID=349273 RepID=UPI0025E36826|nr:hypothetical protein [uncultured Phenylobacterium sp.]
MQNCRRTILVGSIIAGMISGTALAQPMDLIGAKAGQAEGSLNARGYVFDHNEGGNQLWWRDRGRECISLYVSNGRYREIESRSSGDCNLSAGREDKKKKDNSTAIVAGALAVGLLAAAAANHKKDNDRDDDRGGRGSYSPARDVDCYPNQRTCYERGRGYSAYWTNREFKYRY